MRVFPTNLDESFWMIAHWHQASEWVELHELYVMMDWLNSICENDWCCDLGTWRSLWFRNESDAVLFKLTWL